MVSQNTHAGGATPPETTTPAPLLLQIRLRAPAAVPPIVFPDPETYTPELLPRPVAPAGLVPIKSPAIVLLSDKTLIPLPLKRLIASPRMVLPLEPEASVSPLAPHCRACAAEFNH